MYYAWVIRAKFGDARAREFPMTRQGYVIFPLSFSKICRKSSVSTAKLDRKFGKFPKSRRPNERRETKRKAIVLSFPSLEIVNGGANSILEPRRATYTESERINCSRIDRTILIPCNYARSPRRPGPQQLVSTALGNR